MSVSLAPVTRSARFRRVMSGLRIRAESGAIVPMRFSPSQDIIWRTVAPRLDAHDPLRFIVLKGRRAYVSTFFAALTFVRTTEQAGTHSLVIAQDLDTSNDLFAMSRLFYETLPLPKLKPGKVKELEFPFPQGVSRFRVVSAGVSAKGRGMAQSCLHASELAHWTHPEVLVGLNQTVPDLADTILVYESTANGMQGHGEAFFNEWTRAVRGESDFTPIFVPWHVLPKYRRTPGVPEDEWNEEERLLVEQYQVDGEQLAWRRAYIATRCLAGDVRVGTDLGIIPIREASDATTTESGKVVAWLQQGRQDVMSLRTAHGRVLRATADHRIKRPDGTWTPLGALRNGDAIALLPPRFAAEETSIRWSPGGLVTAELPVTERVGLFLGYFMGDGTWAGQRRGSSVEIACDGRDDDVVAEVADLLGHVFGAPTRRYRFVGSGRPSAGVVRVQVAATWHREMFGAAGIIRRHSGDKYRRHVHVPDVIWRSPERVVCAFLAGLFESDGTNVGNAVRLTTCYESFARDVQLLLLGCGIPAALKLFDRVPNPAWTLYITGLGVERFHDTIGFRGARKRVRPARKSGPRPGRAPSPISFVDHVVGLPIAAGEEETFDFTIAAAHRFSANGIEVHNCKGDVELFHQEQPSSPEEAFLASGSPAFDRLTVLRQRSNQRPPKWRGDFVVDERRNTTERVTNARGFVRIWEHPREGRQYVIGADTSEGMSGGDYSCAEILDMESLEQVGAIHGHIQYYDFAVLLNAVGRYYNRALLCIEVYPQGQTVQDYLIRKFQYPRLHIDRGRADRIKQRGGKYYGWQTNVVTRPLLIAAGQRAINGGHVTLHEEGLLDEILRFSKNDHGKYEASAGHDDRVIALLLALRSREENYMAPRDVPALSSEMEGLPTEIRVAEVRDPDAHFRRRISRLLVDRARAATKGWMSY